MALQKLTQLLSKVRRIKTMNYGKVDSVDFAIYLNEKAKAESLQMNVTKIQKLLYICYGLYFAAKREPLLSERPQAWEFGPVFPRVHKKQKKNGNNLDGIESSISFDDMKQYDDILLPVLRHFGRWSASGLVEWTHQRGNAWDKKYNNDAKYAPLDEHDIIADFQRFVS